MAVAERVKAAKGYVIQGGMEAWRSLRMLKSTLMHREGGADVMDSSLLVGLFLVEV